MKNNIKERKNRQGKTVYDVQFMYKRQRIKKNGFSTKGEANRFIREIKNDIDNVGKSSLVCNKTFLEVYQEWFKYIERKFSLNTIYSYNSASKKLTEKIKYSKIRDLNLAELQTFINMISNQYGKGTCKNVLKILNGTFKYAMKNHYISYNPMQDVELIMNNNETNIAKKNKIVSHEDFMKICDEFLKRDTFNNQSMCIALLIGYYTGARVTEVLALSKNDIDFNNNTITFNKRLEHRAKERKSFPTKMKTEASYATLSLAEPLKAILLEWFVINPYENICVYENGNYIEYGWFQKKIQRVSKKLEIDFTFHTLRHTLATNLAQNGIHPTVAQKILRHKSIKTTIDIYTHINLNDQSRAFETIFCSKISNTDYPEITPILN